MSSLRKGRRLTRWQLTAIVGAIVVAAVLVPVGVRATTNSVLITDPSHPAQQAHVIDGRLQIGDGSGPLTIDGNILSVPGQAPTYFSKTVHMSFLTSSLALILGPDKEGTRYAITSVTLTNDGTQNNYLDESVGVIAGSDKTGCNNLNSSPDGPVYVAIPWQQTVHLAYPQALITRGQPNPECLVAAVDIGTSGGWDVHINVTGYRLS